MIGRRWGGSGWRTVWPVLLLLVIGSGLAAVPAPRAEAAAPSSITRADYEACQARDESSFRVAIETITAKALKDRLGTVDFQAVVAEEWRRASFDEIIDARVDLAVAEVRDEQSLLQLWTSLASREKAQELATAVTERVYRSDAVKSALEQLATGASRQVARSMEIATLDAAEPTIRCLRAFLGQRYGETVARAVTTDAGRLFEIDPSKGGAAVGTGSVALEGSGALTGAALVIVRRQLAAMTQRIGQRVVGAVLGRLVSTVAGGIGVVLIAKDIWDFRYGVMPIIATEMKSSETKDKVKQELAKMLGEQIGEHSREIAQATAGRIVDIWRDFQRAHAKVVDLAERNSDFRKFVDLAKPEQLPRLDEVVAIVLAAEGEDGVARRLSDGTLHHGVNALSPAAMAVARETGSLQAALAWSAVAGARIDAVVEHELHRRAKPGEFTQGSLTRLLALDDRLSIQRLAAVGGDARTILFELADGELKALTRGLGEAELIELSRYLTSLDREAGQRVLKSVAAAPAQMQALTSARVRNAILASRDQVAAVGMILRADGVFDPTALQSDVRLAMDGKVSPVLLWEKHPVVLVAAGITGLALLLLLKRLLFGRRRPAVSRQAG